MEIGFSKGADSFPLFIDFFRYNTRGADFLHLLCYLMEKNWQGNTNFKAGFLKRGKNGSVSQDKGFRSFWFCKFKQNRADRFRSKSYFTDDWKKYCFYWFAKEDSQLFFWIPLKNSSGRCIQANKLFPLCSFRVADIRMRVAFLEWYSIPLHCVL